MKNFDQPTGALKIGIEESPELLNNITFAYRRLDQPEWIRNLLANISRGILNIVEKNALLHELYEKRRYSEAFTLKLSAPQTGQVFALDNKENSPTYDTAELKDAINRNSRLLHEIVYTYYHEGQPEYMYNLLKLNR